MRLFSDVFKFDPEYESQEAKYKALCKEILGDDEDSGSDADEEDSDDEDDDEENDDNENQNGDYLKNIVITVREGFNTLTSPSE